MSDLPQPTPRPLARVIAAMLDAERHSAELVAALAVTRAALLDLVKDGEHWGRTPER